MFGDGEGGNNLKFDYNYMQWCEDTYYILGKIIFTNGQAAQDYLLGDTDDSKLTERERLLCVLPLIKWMVEHNMLTPECEDELYLYYKDFQNGKFEGLLGDDEVDEIRKDLSECYHNVFGE